MRTKSSTTSFSSGSRTQSGSYPEFQYGWYGNVTCKSYSQTTHFGNHVVKKFDQRSELTRTVKVPDRPRPITSYDRNGYEEGQCTLRISSSYPSQECGDSMASGSFSACIPFSLIQTMPVADDISLRANLNNNALSQAVARFMAIPVELAELPETIRLVGDSIRTLRKAVNGIKKGNLYTVCRVLGIPYQVIPSAYRRRGRRYGEVSKIHPLNTTTHTLAKWWLQVWYGWMPLLYSVQDAVEYVNRKISQETFIKTYVGRKVYAENLTKASFGPDSADSYSIDRVVRDVQHYKCGFTFETLGLPTWQENLGFKDGLSTVWELTPFSFMIDPIFNLGDFFEACSMPKRLGFVDGYFVKKTKRTLVYENLAPQNGGGWSDSGAGIKVTPLTAYWYNRSKIFKPEAQLPSLEIPGNWKYPVTALALLRAAFINDVINVT